MSRSAGCRFVLGVTVLLLGLPATSAKASDVNASVVCPAQAPAGSQVQVQLRIENREPSALTARVLSSFVGNSGDNLAGIGVFGPRVAVPSVALPSGTPGSYYDVEPSVTNLEFNAAPAVPSALAGTVATLLIVLEVEKSDGNTSVADVTECLIEVP